ncbi:hypothetical protein HZH66_014733 [Vespula vulgaris]|uniref:Uncharacterized protein n=1 Tax=Vespula vulgaris TaxID=7454 RepID=A0A834J2B8_VESVU|nr:hypothetical protein HZH66_014733 [Vespula vulgaris]
MLKFENLFGLNYHFKQLIIFSPVRFVNQRIHLSEGGWGRGWHGREFNWNAERFARARKSKHPFPPTAYSLAELTAGNQGNWVVPSMSMQGSQ